MNVYRVLRGSLVAAASICAFVWVSQAAAQAAIYMTCDAGAPGAAGATKPPQHIEISSFQWGVGRGITSPMGGSADRESSSPSVSEVVIRKTQDSASPSFFKLAFGTKSHLKSCVIDFDKGSGPKTKGAEYLQITLSNVFVSAFSMSSGGDRPTESITLNFTKIEYKYYTQNGATGGTTQNSTGLNAAGAPKPTPSPSPKPKT